MSDDNIVGIRTKTTLRVPPSDVLQGAIDADLADVMVIGWGRDMDLYLGSSDSKLSELLYMLELAKKYYLEYHDYE